MPVSAFEGERGDFDEIEKKKEKRPENRILHKNPTKLH
jgi:hypothetical protein